MTFTGQLGTASSMPAQLELAAAPAAAPAAGDYYPRRADAGSAYPGRPDAGDALRTRPDAGDSLPRRA